jgi:ADP-ribose pyrophosphatase YjhB (NUDIX family)
MKDTRTIYHYIPGGRISLMETSGDAVVREFQEELSAKVSIERLLWVNENFFHEDYFDEDFHEICFYYLMRMEDDSILARGACFKIQEREDLSLEFHWHAIEELSGIVLKPAFLQTRILHLSLTPEHFIHRDN